MESRLPQHPQFPYEAFLKIFLICSAGMQKAECIRLKAGKYKSAL